MYPGQIDADDIWAWPWCEALRVYMSGLRRRHSHSCDKFDSQLARVQGYTDLPLSDKC